VLVQEWRLRTGGRIIPLRSLRFASVDDRHLLGQALDVVPEDWQRQVTVDAIIDGYVTNEGGVRSAPPPVAIPACPGLLPTVMRGLAGAGWPPG
jgi:hypothetical protein